MPTKADRAKIFIPYDALKGFKEILAQKEKIIVEKRILGDDELEELDQIIHTIQKGMIVQIVYYHNEEYIQLKGVVSKIDLEYSKSIQIVKKTISLNDIVQIQILEHL